MIAYTEPAKGYGNTGTTLESDSCEDLKNQDEKTDEEIEEESELEDKVKDAECEVQSMDRVDVKTATQTSSSITTYISTGSTDSTTV